MKQVYFHDIERAPGVLAHTFSKENRSISSPYSYSPRVPPNTIEWVRHPDLHHHNLYDFSKIPDNVDTVVWTDRTPLFYFAKDNMVWTLEEYKNDPTLYNFTKPMPNKKNVLIIAEPIGGCGEPYILAQQLSEFRNKFDVILSHNKDFCKNTPNAKWYPWGTSQLDSRKEIALYPKRRGCSFNFSDKQWWEGHKFRYNTGIALKSSKKYECLDIFGPFTYENYIKKLDTLREYYFSIQIENQIVDDFFTDKIIDCFLTGTIPIYRGTSNIVNYFDTDGIIQFNTFEELEHILEHINRDVYFDRFKAIEKNLVTALKYINPEDWISNAYPDLF